MDRRGICLLFTLFCIVALGARAPKASNNIGFAFSGAGGRIAQHLSLMEALVKGLTPSGQKIRPSYLSGASSGALSSIVLNAILETEDKHLPNGITWDYYKNHLFNISNGDIYDTSIEGIAKVLLYNIPIGGYILDNSNLKKFISPYLDQMNYKKLGDLYIPTSISVMNQTSGNTIRLWSNDPICAEYDILEVIMSSTAMPLAFPPGKITLMGDTPLIDGGTGIDALPVFALLDNPNVDEVYLIAYGSAMTDGGGSLPYVLNDIKILVNAIAVIADMRVDYFNGALEMARDSKKMAYSFIPAVNQSFSALEFDYEKLEYQLAYNWAIQNNPTKLN